MNSNNIAVILSSYNGERYILQQLNSLQNQTYTLFDLFICDDYSHDNTLEIIQEFSLKTDLQIKIFTNNKNLGIIKSFETLLYEVLKYNQYDYIMFCDQDDIWGKNKISESLKAMKDTEKGFKNSPILIHTDLTVIDENLNLLNHSFISYQHINPKYNKLNNLLIQNTVTGCTTMLNSNLAKLCLPIPKESIMHDWWLSLVASKFGKIIYINHATIRYRQHTGNSVGANRFNSKYILNNIFKAHSLDKNISQAIAFLRIYRNYLDIETIEMLENFINIYKESFFKRRLILIKYKLFKHGLIRNIGLLLKI